MSATLDTSVWGRGEFDWSFLQQQLKFPLPRNFPLPLPNPDDKVAVEVSAHVSSGPTVFQLQFDIRYVFAKAIEIPLWGGKIGRDCRLTFFTEFLTQEQLCAAYNKLETASASETPASPANQIKGTIQLEISIKPPPLPVLEMVRITTGDADGWVKLHLTVDETIGANGNNILELGVTVLNPFTAEIQFPGLQQPSAPVVLEIEQFEGSVIFSTPASGEASPTIGGTLTGKGRLTFNPQITAIGVPIADYLKPLLEEARFGPIEAQVECKLGLDDQRQPVFNLSCTLDGLDVHLNLFEALEQMMRGVNAPASVPAAAEVNCKKYSEFDFELRGVWLCIGKSPSFALQLDATLAGIKPPIPIYLELSMPKTSGLELRFGLGRATPKTQLAGEVEAIAVVTLPIRIPRITRQDLGFLKEGVAATRSSEASKGTADYEIWSRLKSDEDGDGRDGRDTYNSMVDGLLRSIEELTGAAEAASSGLFFTYQEGNNWIVVPRDPGATQNDTPVRVASGSVAEKQANGSFKETGELAIACQVDGNWHLVVAKPTLRLDDFSVGFSFQNPRNIRVSGKVNLTVEGPFEPISHLHLTLGISADMIYFALDADNATIIPIPEFIPGYGGGSITIGRFMFGFGYPKRSLAVALDGGIKLPERVVEDLDTSDVLGAGVRLPVQSKLSFRLDVIPLVMGSIVIPFPLLQFNVDLRQDSSPGLRDSTSCVPYWDGLQLIVKDVIRVSLKHISYSYVLGLYACSNSDFDGDLMLGDQQNGLTVVADDIFWAYGQDSWVANLLTPIGSTPFFNNLCVNLRLAGFGVNFDLQRPIPSFSPLAIFEMLALIADPLNYEVSPRGELADMVRASLTDAYIVLPESARRLFPQAEALLRKPVNVTINLATYISLLQYLGRAVQPFAEALTKAFKNREQLAGVPTDLLEKFANNDIDPRRPDLLASLFRYQLDTLRSTLTAAIKHPEQLQEQVQPAATALQANIKALTSDLLAMLPPELRKVRLEANFAGFKASAVLVLTDREGARKAFERLESPAAPSSPAEPPEPRGDLWERNKQTIVEGSRLKFRKAPGAPRMFDVDDPNANPLLGREFAGFKASDLDEAPPPLSDVLLLTADLRPLLVHRLASATAGDKVSPYLLEYFSSTLRKMISEHVGGQVAEQLKRSLVGELNEIVRGGPDGSECIYTSDSFDGIPLNSSLQRLLAQHQEYPLSGNELARLNRMLLEAAYQGGIAAAEGVLVGARVRVFSNQQYRFLGFLFADGSFSLITALEIDPLKIDPQEIAPLRLTVAGLSVELPLEIVGRLSLTGRARRSGVSGVLRAEGHADWHVIKGVLRVSLGDKKSPVALDLYGTGQFRLKGQGEVNLFNGAARLKATFDISETHCFVSGSFSYEVPSLLSLFLSLKGRLGPARKFELTGSGRLELLGMVFPQVEARVNEAGAEVAFRLLTKEWKLPKSASTFPYLFDMYLRGRIDLRKRSNPSFELRGDGSLQVSELDAKIEGSGGISAKDGSLSTFIGGKLCWRGREWLQGRIDITNDELTISGRASFGIRLKPSFLKGILSTPSGIRLAELFLDLNLGCEITFGGGALLKWRVEGSCTLAAQLEGSGKPLIPLAAREFGPVAGGTVMSVSILPVQRFRLVPLPDFTLPIPNIALDNRNTVKIKKVETIGLATYHVEWNGQVFPPLPPGNPVPKGSLEVPIPSVTNSSQTLNMPQLDANFDIKLIWKDDMLQLDLGGVPIPLELPDPNP